MQFYVIILRSFVLYHFNHSCHIIIGNDFVEFIWKFPNYSMFCNIHLREICISPPPFIMLLTRLYLIPFFYQTFSEQVTILLRQVFVANSSQTTTDGDWNFKVVILGVIYPKGDLTQTHYFVSNVVMTFILVRTSY